jgi:nucleoside-diphosphate-sugar epimerase
MIDRELGIAVLGASGSIGSAAVTGLMREGFSVVPIARRYSRAQSSELAGVEIKSDFLGLDSEGLAEIFAERRVDIVVNCVGLLQDRGTERTEEVHREFVGRILDALVSREDASLLIHVSVPGRADEDRTAFSRTKRQAERLIEAGSIPFVILRPGFVVAPSAYGGGALVRSLAASPIGLAHAEADRPFAATDIADICRTIAVIARRWRGGEREWAAVWDVMERHALTVGEVVDSFRQRFGGPKAVVAVPSWLMDLAAKAGDLVSRLGWRPPIRSTALQELRRGVESEPAPWISATGVEPAPLAAVLQKLPATLQETWFARLYLAKALILASLVFFWMVSGLIAVTVAFNAATAILISHEFSPPLARTVTWVGGLIDIAVGVAIAFKRTSRLGLWAGIGVSLVYLGGATLFAPGLWIEPLGALIKTIPAIVLMIVALAVSQDRGA